jgi:uncharacterized protein
MKPKKPTQIDAKNASPPFAPMMASVTCCVLACFASIPVVCTAASVESSSVPLDQTSEGDQFLDGIGETALVARYILAGDAEDWSRNNHHASVLGAAEIYVDDEKFGRVLSLDGGNGGFLKIPGDALIGLDTVSVTGWVFFRSTVAWQRFFDFGQDARANFFCTPIGGQIEDGFRARITAKGWTAEQGPASQRIALNRWVHLAVVLDAANRTLTIHADGKRISRATGVQWTLEDVLDPEDGDANHLFIGKSQYAADATANVKLHDVRIYAIALTDTQVSAIGGKANASGAASFDSPLEQAPEKPRANAVTSSMIYGAPIIAVADVTVETVVGHLPRLPLLLPAKYEDGVAGPDVRVIWPAPTDNAQVLQPGTYALTGRIPGTDLRPQAVVRVLASSDPSISSPTRSLETFPLSAVTLNKDEQGRDTPFIKNRDKFLRGLAATNPDSFLYMFRDAFGQEQPPSARPLAGWDSQTTRLRGHASGHYLSAIAQAYAGCVQDEPMRADFKRKMDYMVDVLYDLSRKSGKPSTPGGEFNADPATVPPGPSRDGYTSDLSEEGLRTDYWNWGEGFISAYPPDQFIMLEHGATYGGGNDQVWAPYYTLHKILAGLLDCYEIGGNEKAWKVANEMGLWVHRRLERVPMEGRIRMWNRYIAGEFGGMNEVLARLYRTTDDERFLQCAQMFDNIEFFFGDADHSHGLARNVDTIRGKHANQHIPQITGALEVYRSNRAPPYFHLADNFWHMCHSSYMYVIGGVAGARRPNNAECFTAEPDSLFENGFSPGGQNETCATYNLLKLSRQLFLYSPAPKYMDYYEQALYNHILASVAENDAGNTYHVPLNPGARKNFGNAAMNAFTCCNGTALESSTKLQDSIYFRSTDNARLYVNLFIPSTLHWKERGVTVTQSTSFPYSDRTTISLDGTGDFTILIRVPQWASSGMHVSINGQRQLVEAVPGELIGLDRTWESGDTIQLQMPIGFRLVHVMDQPNLASIFYGPVLLAVQEPGPRSEWRKVPLNTRNLSQSIEGDASTLRFTIGALRLKPFFETYGRHSVYLDITSE